MGLLRNITMLVSFVLMWGMLTVLFIDALEYEATGQCRDCVVLQKLRPGLNE